MNELLAIILIVIVCCGIFFAWLLSMATCPDKMINWLSGNTGNSTCSTSYESKELIGRDSDEKSVIERAEDARSEHSASYGQVNNSNLARRSNSKKLSVVPEQDEQLTVTSISQILYPAQVHRQNNANVGYNADLEAAGNNLDAEHHRQHQQLMAHFEVDSEGAPEAVVIVGGQSAAANGEDDDQHLNGQTVRYHYSLPAIHVA